MVPLLFKMEAWEKDEEFRLQFEAVTQLDPDEKTVVRSKCAGGVLLKHVAKRLVTTP